MAARILAAVTTGIMISSLAVFGGPADEATAADGEPGFGVGTTSLATPASGSRYIYVSRTGDDFVSEYQQWLNGGAGGFKDYLRDVCLTQEPDSGGGWGSQTECPEPTIDDPLATVQLAMRIARPGDVIVIRGGTYSEAIGWGITVGTASKPIVMQSYPRETVTVSGQLTLAGPSVSGSLVGPDYWRIRGIRFVTHPTLTVNQSIVTISGGTGWTFENNLITGSTGVANLLVVNKAPESSSSSQRTAGAPKSFVIRGNCITDNRGTGSHGQFHNIYMMSSAYSTGGVIEQNLLAGAPRGANIKIAAANTSQAWRSPANLTITDNTLLYAASGITVGLNTRDVEMSRNLIAEPLNELQYDGAIKTYQMVYPGLISFTDSFVSDYNQVVEYDGGDPPRIDTARIQTGSATFTGSVANCSVVPTSWPAAGYGHVPVTGGSGAVTGRVLIEPLDGGSPQPASEGHVQFWAASSSLLTPTATALLTPSGTFSISGLPAGQYRVAFVSHDDDALPVREWHNNKVFGADANLIALVDNAAFPFGDVVLEERTVSTERFAGANRFETATKVSEFFLNPGAERDVVIVNGQNFPDALGAGPLATQLGGPLLMVTQNAIPAETRDELERINPLSITIVGGTGVVSSAVEAQLASYVGGASNVTRVSGSNRYATSLEVVKEIDDRSPITELFLATGRSFPDALSAVPAAGSVGGAVLLIDGGRSTLDAATAAYIDGLNVRVTIVGGIGVVSTGIQTQLANRGVVVGRVAGPNRYATSIAIARQYFPYAESAYLANGLGFADALAIGPWAGAGAAPVYLTQPTCITDAVFDDLLDGLFTSVTLVGGTSVLGPRVKAFEPCTP